MTVSDDYPELSQFFGVYFNQDYDLDIPEGGDWRDVVDNFTGEETADYVANVIAELDRLLSSGQGDQELKENVLRLSDYFPSVMGVGDWLIAIRLRLAAALDTKN